MFKIFFPIQLQGVEKYTYILLKNSSREKFRVLQLVIEKNC